MPIAESLGLAALGWVVSPVVKDLITKSIAFLGRDIAADLKDLETTLLPQFQLTIQAAQFSPHKDTVARWLLRLKNAYYDAEGILHELEYKRLRRKVNGEQNKIWVRISSHPIIKPFAKCTSKVRRKVSLLSGKKRKLWNQLNSLKKIAAEAPALRELLKTAQTEIENGTTSNNNPPITTSQLPHIVFGRDDERDQIIKFLLGKDEKGASSSTPAIRSYSVVAIVGIGGAGKTTLAQYVYNDEQVEQHFGARIWLCLSQNINSVERTKDMIECITKKRPDLTNLNELRNNLTDALRSELKGFLLVLDNFWPGETEAKEDKQWEDLLAPFTCVRGKLKILVTSRSGKFPVPLLPAKLIKLSDLADSDFLSLFRYYAGLGNSNSQLQNDLYNTIGNRIVKKLSKSPLAARTVGEQLYKKRDPRFWQITERNVNLSDTMEVLLWSFQSMDVQIQRCFLFCGVFPQNVWYTGYDLVQYWIALDFILPSDNSKSVEEIGYDYFQMMLASSIFQFVNGRYTMHDLFHDLAQQLSAGDCFRVENGERQIPPTTLHLYLSTDYENFKENLSSLCHLRNLRTLILDTSDMSDIIPVICTTFKNLRVLDIWSEGYEILPNDVGGLKNLRYVNVWKSHSSLIQALPISVLQLYHLQFLILPQSIKILPTKLGDLIELRSVGKYDKNYNHVSSLPPVPYLGKLTSLHHLDEFHVGREEGYRLEQLGCLRQIGGSLRIVNLENVRNEEEAAAARLFDKPKLEHLELVWSEIADNIGSDLEVLEALWPPPSLELLRIEGYRGSRLPTWLQLSTFPENLTKLQISKCPCLILVCENELQVNANWGIMEKGLLTFATYKYKEILHHELISFKQTGSMQNCMEQLQIIENAVGGNCPTELWGHVNRAWWRCHQQRMKFIFNGTTRAYILKSLPLSICNLHLSYFCISDGALSDCLRGMVSLEELHLEGIMTIITLPPADVLLSLQSLRVVRIAECWCLRSLGSLNALSHLQHMNIVDCPEISGLPELPSSVRHIEIGGCPVLTARCQPNGADWHKIKHINIRRISSPNNSPVHWGSEAN